MTHVLLVFALLASSLGIGCAFGEFRPEDPFRRKFTLEDKHKEYTDNVRWSKFAEAAAYMEAEDRQAFLDQMPNFDEVRFTDWEAVPWELEDEDMTTATIHVTYKGYSLVTPIEVEVKETQYWTRTGKGNSWTVYSKFENLEILLGGL